MDHTPRTHLLPGSGALSTAITLLVLVGVSVVVITQVFPPPPKPLDAPPEEFSAYRAHEHLQVIAKEPHPTGSPACQAVREYLVETIEAMGYAPEVQRVNQVRGSNHTPYSVKYTENVVVHVPGTAPTKAMLHMAHYDSVAYGKGAADDGAGVVAMLETLRALKHHPPLKNDLIFVFTDAEEGGLQGARAFLEHELFPTVGLVLNYEARGYWGPSMMFELSDGNGWIIQQVAKAAPHPLATSMMFDIAGRMPTTTDYEVLKGAGVPGMGLAFIGGIEYYHTQNDSPEKISLASMQHHGEYGLPLALHFGNLDLTDVRAPNQVYFNATSSTLVQYSEPTAMLLSAFGVLLYLGAVVLGLLKRYVRVRGIVLGMVAHVLTGAVVAAVVGAIIYTGFQIKGEYLIYNTYEYLIGFVLLTVALFGMITRVSLRWASGEELALGAMAWWCPLLAYVTANFIGGSYLLLWPLVGASAGLGIVFLLGDRLPMLRHGVLLAGVLPGIAQMVPTIFTMTMAVTIIPSSVWMSMLVLLLGLMIPVLAPIVQRGVPWLPASAMGVATPLLAYAIFGISFTPDTPKMNHLCYGVNCSTDEAYWMSKDAELDEWLAEFFEEDDEGTITEFNPRVKVPVRKAAAPRTTAPDPEVEVLFDSVVNNKRQLHLKVKSPRRAARIHVATAPGVQVFDASLNGKRLGDGDPNTRDGRGDQPWRLSFQGLSYDGLDLTLTVMPGEPLRLVVREESFDIPPVPGTGAAPRPPHMVTENNVVRWYAWGSFRSNVWYSVKEFTV